MSTAPSISLLVPFRVAPDDSQDDRARNWSWLQRYWERELPEAEIVLGHYDGVPFSKTAAVNDAAGRASGEVLVILDADCYLDGQVITDCAERIMDAEARGRPLWFVPYRHFHRLPPEATEILVQSDPTHPLRFHFPYVVDDGYGAPGVAGHHYGALVTIMPAAGFWQVGGMDERFVGWGGEDIAFMHAVDTLYGRHRTSNNDVFHLYHAGIGSSWDTRRWSGQSAYMPQHRLAMRYSMSRFDQMRMRSLVDEDLALDHGRDNERHRHRDHRHHRHHHHNPYRREQP
jgi:glycosyl transferase family 7 (putative galactosyltransferase)